MDCGQCTEFPKVKIKNLELKCKYCDLHQPPVLWTPMENNQPSISFHTGTQKPKFNNSTMS